MLDFYLFYCYEHIYWLNSISLNSISNTHCKFISRCILDSFILGEWFTACYRIANSRTFIVFLVLTKVGLWNIFQVINVNARSIFSHSLDFFRFSLSQFFLCFFWDLSNLLHFGLRHLQVSLCCCACMLRPCKNIRIESIHRPDQSHMYQKCFFNRLHSRLQV